MGLLCGERGAQFPVFFAVAGSASDEVNPNILSTTGLKFEGLVFATAGSSCIAILGWLQDRIVDSAFVLEQLSARQVAMDVMHGSGK